MGVAAPARSRRRPQSGGIALLASCFGGASACRGADLPAAWRSRLRDPVLLQVAVLVLAASGVVSAGH